MSGDSALSSSLARFRWMRAAYLPLSFGLACSVTVVAYLVVDESLHPSLGHRDAIQFAARDIMRVTTATGVLGLIFALGVASSAIFVRRLHVPGVTWTILGGAACGLSGGLSLCSARVGPLLAVFVPFLAGLIVSLASWAATPSGGRR